MQTTEPRAILFDTETTTTGDTAEIIESAWRDVILNVQEPGIIIASQITDQRWMPQGAVAFGAMAVHHIINADLVGCEPSENFRLPAGTTHLIGHNIDFDWRVAGKPDVKRICTLALARRLWPTLDSHSQGALLYYLLPENEARFRLQTAHSAKIDVMNLSLLAHRLVGELQPRSWDDLWQMSEAARIPVFMPFGKHRPAPGEKGIPIAELPRDYLEWLLRQPAMDEYVVLAAKRALAR